MKIVEEKKILMEFTEEEAKEILKDFKDMSGLQSELISNSSLQLYKNLYRTLR